MPDNNMNLGELFNAVGRLIEQHGYSTPTDIVELKANHSGLRKIVTTRASDEPRACYRHDETCESCQ